MASPQICIFQSKQSLVLAHPPFHPLYSAWLLQALKPLYLSLPIFLWGQEMPSSGKDRILGGRVLGETQDQRDPLFQESAPLA